MSLSHELHALDDLVAELPYELDDTASAGDDFRHWIATADPVRKRRVDLWTYCYIRRYFLVKFMRESGFRDAELEPVVEKAYRSVERGRVSVRDPIRYARWVSVVCRKTYLSFVTRRRQHVPVDRVAEPAVDGPTPGDLYDSALILSALLAAIGRLPVFLRRVAHMKFVHDLAPDEIGRRVGKSAPTVRAYVHKALVRIREDPVFHEAIGTPGYVSVRGASDGKEQLYTGGTHTDD